MWLADVSIRRPVFATMLIVSLVVLGLVSFGRLGVDLFPEVEFPYVSVTTTLPGASPGTIETEVTDIVEEQLNTIAGLRQMRSVSAEGVSIVNLEFELEQDADLMAQEVRDKMSRLGADLPADAEPPVIEKVDPDAAPILSVLLSGDMPIRDLTTFADEDVKERLQRVPGVGSVELVGGREREMRIWLDASPVGPIAAPGTSGRWLAWTYRAISCWDALRAPLWISLQALELGSTFSCTSKSRVAGVIAAPRSPTTLTASSLNSQLNFLRRIVNLQ